MRVGVVMSLGWLTACSTLSGARPLAPGQHEVGVHLGGPLFQFGGPVPLPNVVVGARSGLTTIAERPLDLGYGTNLTALPFGIISAYGDLGYLLVDQNGAVPALTLRNKLLLTTNAFAGDKSTAFSPRGFWGADQIDLMASWQVRHHVVYGTLGQVFDFGQPDLLLVPGIGASMNPRGPGGPRFQAEVRWWAINQQFPQRNINWIPGAPGAVGVHLGIALPIGGKTTK